MRSPRSLLAVSRAPRRHLQVDELVDSTTACPVCLDTAHRHPVCRVQVDPDVHMLACRRCGACSASHMPRADVLDAYYGTYYADSDRRITFSDPHRFARHLVGALPRTAFGARMSILDFGGGDGSLSLALADRLIALERARAVDVLIVDFQAPSTVLNPRISVRHRSPDDERWGEHDLVLASAVLEHVPGLHALLQKLHGAMAPNGLLYARTPYVVPLVRLWPRLDLTYPAHVHDLGSPFWLRVDETFGWHVRVLASRPSVVASRLRDDPVRTCAAFGLKLPAHVENWLSPRSRRTRLWPLVGGWEVLLRRA